MPDRSSLCLSIQPLEDPFYYHPTIYAWVFQVVLFPQVSARKLLGSIVTGIQAERPWNRVSIPGKSGKLPIREHV